jgi:hypothetical protein
VRTFIALEDQALVDRLNAAGNEHNETYAFFPDRPFSGPTTDKPGDTRWQAAPFMAHAHYGASYKWMLLGDDDTLWFLMGACAAPNVRAHPRPGPTHTCVPTCAPLPLRPHP